tara:strand:+ start:381 stop:737 length:357 start_codon:yes stop_codon:yes gene_type:complete
MNYNEDFCDKCNNFLYIRWDRNTEEEPLLIKYCQGCGFTKSFTKDTIENSRIYHNIHDIDKSNISIGNNICNDPTLAYENNINCPKCKSEKIKSVIYDVDKMKYIFICCECNSRWKNH